MKIVVFSIKLLYNQLPVLKRAGQILSCVLILHENTTLNTVTPRRMNSMSYKSFDQGLSTS